MDLAPFLGVSERAWPPPLHELQLLVPGFLGIQGFWNSMCAWAAALPRVLVALCVDLEAWEWGWGWGGWVVGVGLGGGSWGWGLTRDLLSPRMPFPGELSCLTLLRSLWIVLFPWWIQFCPPVCSSWRASVYLPFFHLSVKVAQTSPF